MREKEGERGRREEEAGREGGRMKSGVEKERTTVRITVEQCEGCEKDKYWEREKGLQNKWREKSKVKAQL